MELYDKGIDLVFLKQPHINTMVYRKAMKETLPKTGEEVDIILEAVEKYLKIQQTNLIKQAFDFAQKEVDVMTQRIKEGMKVAKEKGKQVGRKKGVKLDNEHTRTIKKQLLDNLKAFNGTMKDADFIRLSKMDASTFYRYKKALREELAIQEASNVIPFKLQA